MPIKHQTDFRYPSKETNEFYEREFLNNPVMQRKNNLTSTSKYNADSNKHDISDGLGTNAKSRAEYLQALQRKNPDAMQEIQDENTKSLNNVYNKIAFDMDEYRMDEPSRLGMKDIETRITVPLGTRTRYLDKMDAKTDNIVNMNADFPQAAGIYYSRTYPKNERSQKEAPIFIPGIHAAKPESYALQDRIGSNADLVDTIWHEGQHKAFYEDSIYDVNDAGDPYFNAPSSDAQHAYIGNQSDKHLNNRIVDTYVPGFAKDYLTDETKPDINKFILEYEAK